MKFILTFYAVSTTLVTHYDVSSTQMTDKQKYTVSKNALNLYFVDC